MYRQSGVCRQPTWRWRVAELLPVRQNDVADAISNVNADERTDVLSHSAAHARADGGADDDATTRAAPIRFRRREWDKCDVPDVSLRRDRCPARSGG